METLTKNEINQAPRQMEKHMLASRYLVGVRTVENWQARRIIEGRMQGRKWMFDVEDCDRRLFNHSQTNK